MLANSRFPGASRILLLKTRTAEPTSQRHYHGYSVWWARQLCGSQVRIRSRRPGL